MGVLDPHSELYGKAPPEHGLFFTLVVHEQVAKFEVSRQVRVLFVRA